jgi:hypothetical protein
VRDNAWHEAFRVAVADNESVFVAGRYAVSDSALEFWPMFPLDRGRPYAVRIRHVKDPASQRDVSAYQRFQLRPKVLRSTTRVMNVRPDFATLPENQLRLYIEFTAPMSREGALPFVHLRTSAGDSVGNAFLPVDGDFWNEDRTRYTLFLDPGRVKRGILPNEQMGRALRRGQRYRLHVDSTWRDSRGVPLAASYQHEFEVVAADTVPIRLADWRLAPPRAGKEQLVVRFPKPLDHGLLRRALGVERYGVIVAGEIAITDDDRAWRFTPSRDWRAGDYRLVVLSILEDLAGNRINRAFEADRFDRVDSTSATPRFTIPFVVR